MSWKAASRKRSGRMLYAAKIKDRHLGEQQFLEMATFFLVRGSVEETLNELLEKEAESLTQAARYERSEARQGYRSGHYDRNLTTTSGDVTLHMPRLKGMSFETAISVSSSSLRWQPFF